ncbi:MAG: DUF374 domain-containing protein, partial [Pseudomonadota bacterium]
SYIRLVDRSGRWTREGVHHVEALRARRASWLVSMWHSRLFLSALWRPVGYNTYAMISANRDGALISAIVGRLGVLSIRGSTYDRAKGRDKGGAQAYDGATEALARDNSVVAMTPDGPRGPRIRAQAGVVRLAIVAQCPVLPYAFSSRWGPRLPSWDRFHLPLPFEGGAHVFGEPLWPPAPGDAAAEARFLAEVEAATTAVADRADALCGREPQRPEA